MLVEGEFKGMGRLSRLMALTLLAIIAISITPLIAVPLSAQATVTVISMESSRTTGTFYNNTIFYVLIDIGAMPTPPDNISVAVRAPSTDGRYYTYNVNASRIGNTLTYVIWFYVNVSGYLKWINSTNISNTPTAWVEFSPPVQFTTAGQYLEVIAGDRTLRLTYSAYEPAIGGFPTSWYAPTSRRNISGWWILAPDLNADPLAKDNYSDPYAINVSIYVGDKYNASITVIANETGINTGNFTLTQVGDLPDVEPYKSINLKFYIPKCNGTLTYTDTQPIDNYWVKWVNITVLPAPTPSIVTDRDYIPLSPYTNVTVYVNVTDAQAIVPVNVSIKVWNFTTDVTSTKGQEAIVTEDWIDETPGTYFNVTLSKCDAIVYCGNFTVNTTGLGPEFIRGKIAINYTAGDGTKLVKELPLLLRPASIKINATEVKYGDVIEITLKDEYWNNDTTKKDSVSIDYIKFTGNASSITGVLSETGNNTAEFKATLTIGEDKDLYADPGAVVTLKYTNPRSPLTTPDATDYITEDLVVSFKVLSFTGKVGTDKDVYGPYGKMVIYVEDWDQNININTKDSIDLTIQLWDGTFIYGLEAKETGNSTGVFKYELGLPGGLGKTATDLVGKTIRILYRDPVAADGKPFTAIKEVSFRSWDPVMSTDKKFYGLGEKVLITVNDPDANKDPNAPDIITVTVTSTSDPIGAKVTLVETGSNTGVFAGEVLVSDTIGPGRVYAKYGDVLTISYLDELPGDYGVTGKSKVFTYTANVGIPVEKPITPKKAEFVDPRTGVAVVPKVGAMVGISVELSNVDVKDQVLTAILVVKDPAGIVVKVDSVSIPLAAGKSGTVTFSVIPKLVGDYVVEVYIVKSLADWTPLGDMLTKVMTVAS